MSLQNQNLGELSDEQIETELKDYATGNPLYMGAVAELTRRQQKKLLDAIGLLNAHLTNFSASSDRYSSKLVFLTRVLIIIGFLTIVVTGVSVWLGYITLQATTEPQIGLQWQYHRPGMDMIDATTTIDLTLENDSFGQIDNVRVFADYFTVAQDKKNFGNMWVCDWQSNTNEVASTSIVSGFGHTYTFSFPMFNFYAKDGYVMAQKNNINSDSVVRVRVVFNKHDGHLPVTRDFYYEAFDNRTLVDYATFSLPSQIRTRYGTMRRDQIVALFQEAKMSDLDIRCFRQGGGVNN